MLLILIVFEQIVIGAIIENTPAERDGRLRPGDELISVDKNVVAGKPHKYVIDLMHAAARNGQVSLTVRRRVQMPGEDMFCLLIFFFSVLFCFVFLSFFSHLTKIGEQAAHFTGIKLKKKQLGHSTHANSLRAGSLCTSHPHILSVVVDHTYIYPLFIVSSAAAGSVVCVFLGALLPQGQAVTKES